MQSWIQVICFSSLGLGDGLVFCRVGLFFSFLFVSLLPPNFIPENLTFQNLLGVNALRKRMELSCSIALNKQRKSFMLLSYVARMLQFITRKSFNMFHEWRYLRMLINSIKQLFNSSKKLVPQDKVQAIRTYLQGKK